MNAVVVVVVVGNHLSIITINIIQELKISHTSKTKKKNNEVKRATL